MSKFIRKPTQEQLNSAAILGETFVKLTKAVFPTAFTGQWLEAFEPEQLESDLMTMAKDCMWQAIELKEEG